MLRGVHGLEIVVAVGDDARDPGVHVQHDRERDEERPHGREHDVARVLGVVAGHAAVPPGVVQVWSLTAKPDERLEDIWTCR